ncbi:MAG TPA: hypothetical protein VFR48_09510 [Solirubrobacteraceae bacterium]|nr:hypothetical protein [Solirubrobacteraceae bacterium]
MLIDIHQHIWSEPLVQALSRRRELPFVRREHGLSVLFLAGEQPYVIDLGAELPHQRGELVALDGIDRALISLSSPLGIELLPRAQASELIDAYHDGALAYGERFGVWGALALDRLDPDDVDRALDRGCVGISLPAGALGSVDMLARVAPALARLQSRDAPLFLHPGRGTRHPGHEACLGDPLWWPAMTRYVAEIQAAWMVFVSAARRALPQLRVVFAMLAGLAPLQAERLLARGGPRLGEGDPLTFYDVSSYGPQAIGAVSDMVGSEQLLYGSDRPVIGNSEALGAQRAGDWEQLAGNAERLLAPRPREQHIGARRQRGAIGRVAVIGRTTR